MSFPRYPKYKNSGIDWLPPVPAHWNVSRLRHCVESIYSGGTPESGEETFWKDGEEGIPWVAIGDMTRESIVTRTDRCVSEAGLLSKGLRVLPSGTLLYSMYASIGKVATLGIDATINQAILGIVPSASTLSGDFLRYWLIQLEAHLALFSSSNTQDNLNAAKVRSFPVFVPPPADQSVIVRFLDRDTAKIDTLIAEQQRLMELLQEKRQAVISQAVTKGLNPDAPMKPSGVEWLGEVPAHWEVGSLKRHWSATDCKHITAEFVDEGMPVISIREVQNRWIDFANAKRTTVQFFNQLIEGGRRPLQGDLIFSRNATVGEVAEVRSSDPPFAMGQDVVLLRPRDPASCGAFLYHLIRSPVIQGQLEIMMIGSTFKRVNVEEIRSLVVPHPPAREQHRIVQVLEDRTAEFDALAAETQSSIRILQERRSAMIAAAVTGQIDVRGVINAEAA